MNYNDKFMQFVMTPPQQESAKYDMYQPSVSTMRVISDRTTRGSSGLGEAPISSGGSDSQSWVMPVVVIVVSAMALMTLYAVLTKR